MGDIHFHIHNRVRKECQDRLLLLDLVEMRSWVFADCPRKDKLLLVSQTSSVI